MLLTGAGGFLGRALLPRMRELYDRVDTLGRRPASDIRVDLAADTPRLPRRYDAVLHCAGAVHFTPSTEAEADIFRQVNVEGTRRLCDALDAAGVPARFIFISSVAVYGCEEGNDIDESHPLRGTSPYAMSKIQAEEVLTRWCAARGVVLTILRCPLIVGPDAPGNLGAMQRNIARGRYVHVGRGDNRKSIITPADIATLIELAAPHGGIYNAADSTNPSLHELENAIAGNLRRDIAGTLPMPVLRTAALIGDLIGRRSPISTARLRKLSSTLTYSNSKARSELSWEPSDSLTDYGK